jgi:cellulose synthase/poly-beta-1,6-N-acetylglucosamine synthase-like glycosyltransferase
VLVPLYREAQVIPGLVAALRALDYPSAKLDIKLIVEIDDRETRAAIERQNLPPTFEIVAVPSLGPRTKPKACNYALHYARGEFVVIYDAEDRPEPTQLRQAVAAFLSGPAELGCVQARLNYYNAVENWLTRQFSIEYSFWFGLMLPGLQRLGLPIPLGGTSNHFPIAVLRRLGAWDPYNVTEDADLGIRLAQEGYRCRILDSTTYEEATCRWGAWTRQRTRWIKGYIQTYLVHMRRPGELYAGLGGLGFLGFQLVVGGTVAAALLHPLWIAGLVTSLFVWLRPGHVSTLPEFLCLLLLVAGNVCSIAAAALALIRRGDRNLLGSTLFIPTYWLLISVAAYRAVWHWIRRPWDWEKTEHGVTRMSWISQPASNSPNSAVAHASVSASPPKRRMRSVRLRRAG